MNGRTSACWGFAASIACAALAPGVASAESVAAPPVSYPALPAHAVSAEGFAPPGWRLETKVTGDLDGDGVADVVLLLRDTDPRNVVDARPQFGPQHFDTNPRILAVASGRSGAGFDLVLQNHSFIPRTTDPLADATLDEDGIAIEGRTVRIRFALFGNGAVGNFAYGFRLQHRRFELLGYDSTIVDKSTSVLEADSIDFATGRRKVTTAPVGSDRGDKVTWKTLARRPLLTLEQVGSGADFDPLPR